MTTSVTLLLFGAATVVSLILTYLVQRYAVARAILDHPNDRSLHGQPTPRGGGLAIVLTFLAGVCIAGAYGLISSKLVIALVGGGGMIALVGWIDDKSGVSSAVRFLTHTLAAIWALAWIGGLNTVQLGDVSVHMGIVGSVLAVIGTVWWINLYNFMDGIDGIAGGQALTVAGVAALFIALRGSLTLGVLPVILAGAATGFLFLNWAPARIFMGDVGSGFLGFAFAVLAISAEKSGALPLTYWLMLSGVFIFDSTLTLLRRMVNGERWYSAHRSHAYQRLIAFGYSHREVATGVIVLNLIISVVVALPALRQTYFTAAAGLVITLLIGLYVAVERMQPMYVRSRQASKGRVI